MTYKPDQLGSVMPYVRKDATWFLLGGPADANEAQMMHKIRPRMHIIGFEPNVVMYDIQKAQGFPGLLLPVALWSSTTTLRLGTPNQSSDFLQKHRSSSVCKFTDPVEYYEVAADTLDSLSAIHGPFVNAVLWIDIESAELEALRGAEGLLSGRHIRTINLETFEWDEPATTTYLKQFGFKEVLRWGYGANAEGTRRWWNGIYTLG